MSDTHTNDKLFELFERAAHKLSVAHYNYDGSEGSLQAVERAEAEVEVLRLDLLARMSPGWQPIETAPRNGEKFWCPLLGGKEILLVERFDSVALHSGISNAVIYGVTGKWWVPEVWMPRDALLPSPTTTQGANP